VTGLEENKMLSHLKEVAVYSLQCPENSFQFTVYSLHEIKELKKNNTKTNSHETNIIHPIIARRLPGGHGPAFTGQPQPAGDVRDGQTRPAPEAKILLAPMLAQETQATLKQAAEPGAPDPKVQEHLKGLLQDNELQRVKMARRLQNTKALYQKNLATLNLTGFLSESPVQRPAHFKQLVQAIKARAANSLNDCNALVLMKHEIKSELLELEKLLLEEYITRNTPNVKAPKKQLPSK
jgi:hypothetical protein